MSFADTIQPAALADLAAFASPAQWDGLLPETATPLAEARRYCEWLASTHYENFPVATRLLSPRLRPHFHALYAYCRWSDDLGDEVSDPRTALHLLDCWEQELRACYAGHPRHPVMVALYETIVQCDIPAQPFHDLITAFRRDQTVRRYESWDDVLGYCRYSANPVGCLVLYVCGYRDAELHRLSDLTCTALQLANFWQDVRRDYAIGRIYMPLDNMARHGISEREIATGTCTPAFVAMMRELVGRTWELFRAGLPLIDQLDRHLGVEIELFSRGGMEILRLIERQNYNVLSRRPHLSGTQMGLLTGTVLLKRMFNRGGVPA
ncbi:MAG: squalene synthase HpnC [Acidobacteria bacterium]|nr:squalene synthase HpnC [Acidobacteriota bacterium]